MALRCTLRVEHDGRPRLHKASGRDVGQLDRMPPSYFSIYADDYHASLTFDSIHGLEVELSHIGALFAVLGRLGMTISHSKSRPFLPAGARALKA